MRRLILLLGLVCCLLAVPAGATTMLGEQRVLVLLVTWGPEPYPQETVRQVVFDEAGEFFREASFGKTWLAGDVTPWLLALPSRPECNTRLISRAARQAAADAGYSIASYTRFMFVFPRIECPFSGLGSGEEAFLNGALWRMIVAHELGHTYGLPHASTWECLGGACGLREYGNPYSVMGSGDGHFTAFEKNFLGWLPNVERPETGTLDLFRLELPAAGPQGLKITTARNEYWLEYRDATRDTNGGLHPGGVLINAGINPWAPVSTIPQYGGYNHLLPNPVGRGTPALSPGDRFVEPGAFELSVAQADAAHARLTFSWIDRTAPVLSALPAPTLAGRYLEVGWDEAVETGSGIQRYDVALDGGVPSRVVTELSVPSNAFLLKPRRGRHVVAVVAVDRAGNRSRARSRAFTIR
jgi:gametolysin peptidase M11